MIRITRLKIVDYKNIQNQTFNFTDHNGLTLMIGNNGSGKSNVLEFISDVFNNLLSKSLNFKSNFELDWLADQKDNKVKYYNGRLTELHEGNLASVNNIMDYPKRVIAIYSGELDRLWQSSYKPAYDAFIANINQSQLQGGINVSNVFPRMLYLNKYYWDIALLSLLCSNGQDTIDFLKNDIGIDSVERIVFKFKNRSTYSSFVISPVLQFVFSIDGKSEYTLEEFKKILAGADIDAQQLFEYLYIAYSPKNSKIIENVKVEFNHGLNINGMSEGLNKQLLVKAALELAGHEDTLFLLDEPDAHVHVNNKAHIINTIKQYKINRHIIITSHSPSICKNVESQSIILMNNGIPKYVDNQLEAGKKLASDIVLINMLFTNKHLILTEGKTDIQYIQKAVSLFAANYPKLAGAVEFVELSGTDGHTDLDFMQKITPIKERKIVRLVDRDEAGLKCAKIILGNKNLKCEDFISERIIPTIQNAYLVMLPTKVGVVAGKTYVIEDYFKEDKIRELTKSLIDSEYQSTVFKSFPAVRDRLKSELLPNFCSGASATDMEDFKVLLDLLEHTLTV